MASLDFGAAARPITTEPTSLCRLRSNHYKRGAQDLFGPPRERRSTASSGPKMVQNKIPTFPLQRPHVGHTAKRNKCKKKESHGYLAHQRGTCSPFTQARRPSPKPYGIRSSIAQGPPFGTESAPETADFNTLGSPAFEYHEIPSLWPCL